MTEKCKTVTLVLSDMDKTPLSYLSEHEGFCETDDQTLEAMRELREFGHRFAGIYRITVEKVPTHIVKQIRKRALK